MVLGNFILPHWKSLWIPFFQVSSFILQSTIKNKSANYSPNVIRFYQNRTEGDCVENRLSMQMELGMQEVRACNAYSGQFGLVLKETEIITFCRIAVKGNSQNSHLVLTNFWGPFILITTPHRQLVEWKHLTAAP